MANIKRVFVQWNGLTALPGVSVFYSSAATDVTTDLGTFFNAIKTLFPSGLTWQVPGSGDTLDDASGALVGGWSGTAASVTATGGAGAYAAGCGCYIQWATGAIVGKRRLRGRTFLAPLLASGYDSSGTIAASTISTTTTAIATLAGSSKLVIWHRPGKGLFTGGSSALVTGGNVPDQVTSLKSRRR